MLRVSLRALLIAFSAEVIADMIIQSVVFQFFARGMLSDGMSQDDFDHVLRSVLDTTDYVPWMMLFGTATTIGGAYLAARMAKRIPYYHGLAMGILGILFIAIFWGDNPGWSDYLGVLLTIPASLYGAYLAKKRLDAAT